jgi:hypothetical protein
VNVRVTNLLFGTTPLVIHAQGHHDYKPLWPPIRDAFFGSPRQHLTLRSDLTIVTCNSGGPAMGLLERSLDHLGLAYIVAGRGVVDWINSRDKPRALLSALVSIDTTYTLYADSRDAILIDDPNVLPDKFGAFNCDLVFSADRMNWPPRREFELYENSLAAPEQRDFRYLNGGMWIGRTGFCQQFFASVISMEPAIEAPESEQGILKQLLPRYRDEVRLDHRCSMFQNIGFVAKPILRID